jgi:hypothetical protein
VAKFTRWSTTDRRRRNPHWAPYRRLRLSRTQMRRRFTMRSHCLTQATSDAHRLTTCCLRAVSARFRNSVTKAFYHTSVTELSVDIRLYRTAQTPRLRVEGVKAFCYGYHRGQGTFCGSGLMRQEVRSD